MGGQPLSASIVGIALDPWTGGYWEVASDGGVFAFNAPFFGSMGGQPLNAPIVGIAADVATGGYWEVASDGGVFAFNAPFRGSMGNQPLNAPIVGIAPDLATGGYLEVARDGGVFAFDAPLPRFHGRNSAQCPDGGDRLRSVDGRLLGGGAATAGVFAFDAPLLRVDGGNRDRPGPWWGSRPTRPWGATGKSPVTGASSASMPPSSDPPEGWPWRPLWWGSPPDLLKGRPPAHAWPGAARCSGCREWWRKRRLKPVAPSAANPRTTSTA